VTCAICLHRERSVAERLRGTDREYCFDLDGRSLDEVKNYSVDSRVCGNWTRFINHSCEPNLQTNQVTWDTPRDPSVNIPYLMFVSKQDIPPRTEFTIDYHPEYADGYKRKKKGVMKCFCGAVRCRGWVSHE